MYSPLTIAALLIVLADSQDLDLTPISDPTSCERDGKPGKCVDYTYCTQEYVIASGGVVDGSEVRSGTCPRDTEWCCTEEIDVPTPITPTSAGCLLTKADECPWCVKIYGGNDTLSSSKPYCAGALIHNKVILTAATCAIQKWPLTAWISLPSSSNPNKKYKVQFKKQIKYYNSGSHAFDFGLMFLEKETDGTQGGACLGFSRQLDGDCLSFGFDENYNFVPTPLIVKNGSCRVQGTSGDAYCGKSVYDNYCFVNTGAPVLCSSDAGGSILAGVARMSCDENKALLGSIQNTQVQSWIRSELDNLKIREINYIHGTS